MSSVQEEMLKDVEAAEKSAFEAFSKLMESFARMKESLRAQTSHTSLTAETCLTAQTSLSAQKPLSPMNQQPKYLKKCPPERGPWLQVKRSAEEEVIENQRCLVKSRPSFLVKCRPFVKQVKRLHPTDGKLPVRPTHTTGENVGQWRQVNHQTNEEDRGALVKCQPLVRHAMKPKGSHVRQLWDTQGKKQLRNNKKNLPGIPCHLCSGALLNLGLTEAEVELVCKHRGPKSPPTPPNYWNPGWVSPKPN